MKIVATEKAPKALGPYSQGYVHNGVLYTAGQIAINPEVNDVEATTIEAQTEQVCKILYIKTGKKLCCSKDTSKGSSV